MSVGVAIVGCGLIGGKRVAALPPDARLVSVYDPIESAARAIAAQCTPHALLARTAKDAVSADGVDLVVVATPNALLAPTALLAVDAGRHVLVEKPGATRYEDLVALRDAAAARNVIVRVGFNHRFHPSVRKAHELLAGDPYGPVLNIRARYGHGGRVGYEREWRADPSASGGGELIDQGVHLIDLARLFMGGVDLAFAELRTDFWDMPVEDNAFLALRGTQGGFAWLHASWTEWKNLFSLELAFRDAKLELRGLGGSYGTESLTCYEMLPEMGPPLTSAWEWPQPDRSWALEMADVVAQLSGTPAYGATIDDGVAVFRIVAEAYRT